MPRRAAEQSRLPPDSEQLALDLDAQLDHPAALHSAELRREQALAEVRMLSAQLRQAKRRAIEAGWDVSTLRAGLLARWRGGKGEGNGNG